MNRIGLYPLEIIFGIPPVLSSGDKVAVDTEFFGMNKDRLHRPILSDGSPNGRLALASFCFDGRAVYLVTDEKELPQAFENVKEAVWIFANLKFDVTHLRRYVNIPVRTKKMWDVISIEQIMYSGYYNDFSLADIVRRRLGVYLPKDERGGFAEATELNDELIKYSAFDPLATWHVYQSQRKEISPTDLNLWATVDLPGINAVMSMQGFMVNKEAWNVLADEAVAKRDAIQNKYPDINLNSGVQIGKILTEQGYKLPKTKGGKDGKGGRPSTAIKTLESIKEPNEFVLDLLAYSGTKSLATTYGRDFLKDVEPDGRVYADFHLLGASTGRMSCSRPNLMNVPNKYTDPRYRDCFIAAPGNVLIIGDWSSQEPRIYAYLTQDQKMLDIFSNDLDIYIEAGRLMFGWELTKKDPRRAERMKPTVLGAAYGLTEHGMLREYGIPLDEGRELLDAFFDVFHQARDWNNAQRKRTDYVQTILGRKYWLNTYDWKSLNNALNSPVQGSASDAMKQAGWCFCEEWKATELSPIVNFVHDEIILEVAEEAKDSAIQCLNDCMVKVAEAMHPGIKAKADVAWGLTWNSKA